MRLNIESVAVFYFIGFNRNMEAKQWIKRKIHEQKLASPGPVLFWSSHCCAWKDKLDAEEAVFPWKHLAFETIQAAALTLHYNPT